MLSEELTAEKEKTLALEKEVEEKEHQIELALEKLEKEIAARREAGAQLIIAMKEKGILETKVRELTKATKTVELEKIVVKTTPRLIGKVLTVNKEYSFVVVNLGRENKLKLGDVLSVYRNDEFIGRVQVEKVEEMVCAAAILPEWQDREFRENDEVREI